jgi:hypothetical protein
MNPNNEGFVAISKVAYNPEQGIDPNYVKTILGAALTILDESGSYRVRTFAYSHSSHCFQGGTRTYMRRFLGFITCAFAVTANAKV